MNRSMKKRLALAAAGALVAAAGAAHAGPTSEWSSIGEFQHVASTKGLATAGLQNTTGLGTNFDSSSWSASTSTAPAALTLDAQTAAATTDASAASTSERKRALAASTTPSNTAPVVGSPASVNLTLWNFISSIRAQQVSNPFVTLQASAENIDLTLNAVPAPVPLPPAAWLFGAGLAALVIACALTRRDARANVDRRLVPA